jgi:hypothetical protein
LSVDGCRFTAGLGTQELPEAVDRITVNWLTDSTAVPSAPADSRTDRTRALARSRGAGRRSRSGGRRTRSGRRQPRGRGRARRDVPSPSGGSRAPSRDAGARAPLRNQPPPRPPSDSGRTISVKPSTSTRTRARAAPSRRG